MRDRGGGGGCYASFERLEHNVKFVFIFTLAFWSASSIISQQVLAGYIFVLTGSNKPVGLVKAVQGLAQLLFALPAGFAADFLRRDRILACAGVIGVATALLTGFAFQVGSLQLIYAAFALWGVFAAFQSPAMEALFADSVPFGQRSLPFTLKHMVLNAALVLGPLCAILLFWHFGNSWELPVLRPVMLFGTFVAAMSMAALFQFNDDMAYENQQRVLAIERELNSIERNFSVEISAYIPEELESDAEGGSGTTVNREPLSSLAFSPISSRAPSEFSMLLRSPSGGASGACSPSAMYMTNNSSGADQLVAADLVFNEAVHIPPPAPTCCGLGASHVPTILFLSDFIVSNGAGLTTHFFPLFLFKEFGLSPIQVAELFALLPICVALSSLAAQFVSRCCGRMPVIVSTRLVGTVCLVAMALSTSFEAQCALFLARGAMMRCTEPLRRSLLMDFVPKKQRARWNSLEGLTRFSWAGSAVLGGFLVEARGYRFCFLVTSAVYVAGTLLEMLLIPITKLAVERNSDSGGLHVRERSPSKV
ncbi:hypothetical protein PybrP1_007385 [[Pythium] brassicae (nom. inval.)]|nr:hypothetical protein PybrP1_007385 [[Pythium] brassicae (nom. inval.)]